MTEYTKEEKLPAESNEIDGKMTILYDTKIVYSRGKFTRLKEEQTGIAIAVPPNFMFKGHSRIE